MTNTILLPILTKSEANERGYWTVKARRAKQQRSNTTTLMRAYAGKCTRVPDAITLVRIAPRALDSDNLATALKAIRDGIQDWCGIDDRKLTFAYEQRRGKPHQYAVEVRLEWSEAAQ